MLDNISSRYIVKEMRMNQTTWAVLGMLSIQPMSGYDLHKAIEGSIAHFWSESFGQIYPTLKKLVAAGMVAPVKIAKGGRTRQPYRLTRAGREHLKEWLADPPRPQPARHELLLKLFFSKAVPPSVFLQHLREFRQAQQHDLEEYLEIEKQFAEHEGSADEGFPFRLATLRFGIFHVRAALEWADETIARLDGKSSHCGK